MVPGHPPTTATGAAPFMIKLSSNKYQGGASLSGCDFFLFFFTVICDYLCKRNYSILFTANSSYLKVEGTL